MKTLEELEEGWGYKLPKDLIYESHSLYRCEDFYIAKWKGEIQVVWICDYGPEIVSEPIQSLEIDQQDLDKFLSSRYKSDLFNVGYTIRKDLICYYDWKIASLNEKIREYEELILRHKDEPKEIENALQQE